MKGSNQYDHLTVSRTRPSQDNRLFVTTRKFIQAVTRLIPVSRLITIPCGNEIEGALCHIISYLVTSSNSALDCSRSSAIYPTERCQAFRTAAKKDLDASIDVLLQYIPQQFKHIGITSIYTRKLCNEGTTAIYASKWNVPRFYCGLRFFMIVPPFSSSSASRS